jgi:very-short-patch-repair endonuclease
MQADDAWSAVAELAASQHGVFHRRQAAELNLSSRRLRRAVLKGELRQPSKNVLIVAATPDSWRQRLVAQTMAGGAASHRSAAALHRFDGFRPGLIELTVDRTDEFRRDNVIVHRWTGLSNDLLIEVDGIRCTNVATTLCQLGMVVASSRVEQALDSALRDGASPLWIAQVTRALDRPGPSGVAMLGRLLDDPSRRGALPDSWFERLLSKRLRQGVLPEPVLQHQVCLPSGSRRLDLAFPGVKLGIEAHSRKYHFGRKAEQSDHVRDLELAASGWEVIYVTWSMAANLDNLLCHITAVYQTRLQQLAA